MKSGGSMSHSQGLYYLPLAPIYLSFILILSSHLRIGLPKGLFPVGLPVKILKALLPSSFWLHDLPISIITDYLSQIDILVRNMMIMMMVVVVCS